MAFNFIFPLRAAQAVLAVIVLGLLAYVSNARWWWSSSQVNFLIFVSVWTLLALLYLVLAPLRFPAAAHKFGILAAEALTMLFWFAGFIALAVLLTDAGCSGRSGGVCGAAIAGDVFAAFEWVLFMATTIMAAMHCWGPRAGHGDKADPAIKVQAPYVGA